MRILITGASGFIGSHLTQALLDKGHDVLVCVRHPERALSHWPHITAIKADFITDHVEADWIPRLENVDVVINAVGIIRESGGQTFDALHTQAPIALFQACETVGVKRVIQVSALGADDSAFSHYHKSKRAADSYLRASSLDWAVLMPSIVYGSGAKSMSLFKAVSALPLVPLIDAGDQEIQPIHISDMVKAVMALVDSSSPLRTDIEMVGPTPITMKELYGDLRSWLGVSKARFIKVPYWMALYGARWLGLLGETPITDETVQMLRNGNTGNVEPFVTRFGFKQKDIETVLKETPAQQSDRWHAGLYFLSPLLRITIAFVWLFTGIVSALFFPVEQSYAMLAQTGIGGVWQPIMLYGAAATDLFLGLATLLAYRLRMVVLLQISIILLYTVVITLWLPEHWLHPFGAISKNVPLVIATLVMLVMEGRR